MDFKKPIKVKYWYRYIRKHPSFTGCLINGDNSKAWFKNGEYHREDGPAFEFANGSKQWRLNGTYLTEQDHRLKVRQMKLKLLDIDQHSL